MAGEAVAAVSAIQTLQYALLMLSSAELTKWKYPVTQTIANNTKFDMVIVGGGSAGCTVASRLSEISNLTVLVLEAGSYPPLESDFPGTFTLQPNSQFDWNLTALNDNYTAQNANNGKAPLTIGKMLGGSSSLHHMIYTQGAPNDYNKWAEAANDSSWSYTELLPYYTKSESMRDPTILESDTHGTDGPVGITRETSSRNAPILAAYAEAGCNVVDDMTGLVSGVTEPMLMIADQSRQGNAISYMVPAANRSNLYLATQSTVTKVLIDSNNTAYGVTFINSDGEEVVVYANKEVIIAAGAIFTPQLLMVSGVGPASHLSSLDIPVKADLPVGEGLQDHISACVLQTLNTSDTPATNPFMFPVPMTTQYAAIDSTSSADYQSINLLFPPNSSGMLQLCLNVFQFTPDFCQKIYDGGLGKDLLFSVHNMLHPKSYGNVLLTSKDPTVAPAVTLGLYSNSEDLVNMGLYLANFYNTLANTTYFKEVNSTMLLQDLCSDHTFNSQEFWQCYALAVSSTMWHYSGTCAMGSVVNNRLQVYNVSNLRVVDASVMPAIPGGNIGGAVTMTAEKAAAIIIEDWNLSSASQTTTAKPNILKTILQTIFG